MVPEKLLVCEFRIILLCLYELVVEVNVIPLALFQQAIEEQCVQLVCRVEVVGLASVGCVGNVTWVSSFMALRIGSALHVRSVG